MKKSFPVNINGTIFYIDEDAYTLLNTYLDQVGKAFPDPEGQEIVGDIEARISELFSERLASGATVIVIEDVNKVIEQMGRPQDFSDAPSADQPHESEADGQGGEPTPPPFAAQEAAEPAGRKRLYRDGSNKVLGGVLGGVACYMGWNANVLRLLYVVAALIPYTFFFWVLLYLLAWLVIPEAVTPQQKLEMQGQPVTLGNLGQTILGTAAPGQSQSTGNFMGSLVGFLGKLIAIAFGITACVAGAFGVFFVIAAICSLIVYFGWGSLELISDLPIYSYRSGHPLLYAFGNLAVFMAIIIPCVGVIWGAGCSLFGWKGVSKATIIAVVVVEVLLIIAGVVMVSAANIPVYIYDYSMAGMPDHMLATSSSGLLSFFSLK